MNSLKYIIIVLFIACGFLANAQVSADAHRFSPLANGYIERAKTMADAGNYIGAVDQLRHLNTIGATLNANETEEYSYLLAMAYYELNDSECLNLLVDFKNKYPASLFAPLASMAVGDFYFFKNDWANALDAYTNTDPDRLNKDQRALFDYRTSLALIRTGHYSEARSRLASIAYNPDYRNAYLFYSGYLDYIDGNFTKAYNNFNKVTPGIKGLETGYYTAQIDYTRGEYDKVISKGIALLRKNNDRELDPELNRIIGLSYFKKGDFTKARNFLLSYLESTLSTPEPDATYALGVIEYDEGSYNAAEQRFESLSDLNDKIGQGAWLYLGQIYLRHDNPNAASMAFEKAYRMALDKDVTESALYNYATSITRGNKTPFSSSVDILETFVKKYPDSEHTPDIEAWLASAYFNDRNYIKALDCINAVKHPSQAMIAIRQKALYELGVELSSNNRTEDAVKYLRQAANMKSTDANIAAQASLWLGDDLFSLGKYSEARDAYRAFLKDDVSRDNRALGFYNLAYTEYKLGDYKSAASDFASALNTRPELNGRLSEDALVRRADCLYYLGNYSEASSLLDRVIADKATSADYALYRRAILKGLAGNTSEKINDLVKLEKDFPQSRWLSKALLELAQTYEAAGKSSLAADAYKKRLALTDNIDIDELLRMASAMNSAGRWNDLRIVTDKIRHAGGLEPDELSDISLYEANALSGLGKNHEANAIYSLLAENPTSLPGSIAAVALAEYELNVKDFESAKIRMEEFTDTGTPHEYWLARGFIALADAYAGLGQKSLAKEYLKSLEDNYPSSNDDIKQRLSSRLKKL